MFDFFERWLRLGAARLHDAAPDLTALDQAIGDGDHGINMDRGFSAIVAQLDAGRPDADGDRALTGTAAKAAGRTLISTVGGAAGPLYGTAFIRGGTSILTAGADRPPSSVLVAAVEAAISGIAGLGKATTGEKTMLDALVPAHTAGLAALEAGGGIEAVVRAMADAAEAGAVATVPMLATKGRASYLGARSIGHQDPGATSAALLMRALADAVTAS
jgi:phosphoenolpyruvate---glycerone phosphotransferase subunit DhaL